MSLGIIAAGIGAVGAIGGAAISARAQSKASAAAGRLGDGSVDIEAVSDQAREADLRRIADTNANEDPTMAAARKSSDQALLNSVVGDPNVENANNILKKLFTENINLDPRDADFQSKLKAEAANQLALGGQLSPEQQAELVRSGLESTSASGFGAGSGAGKQTIGKLLVSEQERLATERQARAKDLFGFATDLQQIRNNNLLGISGSATATASANQNRLLNIAGLVDSRKETVGLTGGDIANLAVGNQNSANQAAANQAQIASQNAIARGQSTAALIGGLTSAAGQGLSAYQANRAPLKTVPGTNRQYSL